MGYPRTWLLAVAIVVVAASAASAEDKIRKYNTKYYVIHSDLDADSVREAAVRMTAMAEEYHERTKSFSGSIKQRFPFYLFSDQADYYKAGAMPGSSGVFIRDRHGSRLMAYAGKEVSATTWHVIQHEGFHQFAHHVIGGEMPTWVNEGLAEYFGHGVYTGDGFVTGVVPPMKLRIVQSLIAQKKFRSVEEMMGMSQEEWNSRLSGTNYAQAWAMVHFLVHAGDGKYRDAFAGFIKDIGRKRSWGSSWKNRFGTNVEGFQEKLTEWWKARTPDESRGLYTKAVVATLTSYMARAFSQRQKFETAAQFLDAAGKGELKADKDDWLPPSLLAEALQTAPKVGDWTLEDADTRSPKLVCKWPGGTWVGSFKLTVRGNIDSVRVDEREQPKEPEKEAGDEKGKACISPTRIAPLRRGRTPSRSRRRGSGRPAGGPGPARRAPGTGA